MEGSSAGSTYVYVDGQNLRGSAREFFGQSNLNSLDLNKLVHRVAASDGARVEKARYYSGVRPASMNDGIDRAVDIEFLHRLRAGGMTTFGNDLVRDALGRWGENGIDLKLSCDMIVDFLNDPKARTFMLVSNDTDFAPTFELLKIVAANTKPPRDVDCVQVLCSSQQERAGIKGVRKIDVLPSLYRACLTETNDLQAVAEVTLKSDEPKAHDLGSHRGVLADVSGIRMSPTKKKTAFYVDANSLGGTCKERGREGLDLDIRASIEKFVADTGRKAYFGHVVASVPDIMSYPVQNHAVRSVLDYSLHGDRSEAAVDAQRVTPLYEVPMAMAYYAPKVAVVKDVASSELNVRAKVPVEKRIETEILKRIVLDFIRGHTDDVVLVSDRRSLWPIAEVVRSLGKMMNSRAETSNVHLVQPGIEGMRSYHVDEEMHRDLTCERDHFAYAKEAVAGALEAEREAVGDRLTAKFGPRTRIEISPPSFEGRYVETSGHYTVLDGGGSRFALVRNFPVIPREDTAYEYRVTTRGDERCPEVRVVPEELAPKRSLMPLRSYASSGPVDRDSGSSSVLRR